MSSRSSDVPREGESIFKSGAADYRVDHETGCWVWIKSRNKAGYGTCKPHRLYFQRANPGVDIDGLDVHHTCENKACVNPDHLELKPHAAHLRDHNRALSVLTEAQVAEIRASTKTARELAVIYGTKPKTIENIWFGVDWKGVGPSRPVVHCSYCGDLITEGKRSRRYCNSTCRVRAGIARQTAARQAVAR